DGLPSRQHVNRIQSVQHHSVLVRVGLLRLVRQGFRMRAVMDAARVKCGIARLDIVFAEEIAVVVEDEFVVVRIAVKERDAQSLGILFERPRQETAYYGALGLEGGMRTRRKMRPV